MTSILHAGPRPHPLELRVPPLVVGLLIGAIGWLGCQFAPQLQVNFSGRRGFAFGLTLLGVWVSVLGVAAFRRARTTVNPRRPQSATALVVGGIYRVTRNPMYLGFVFLLAGWAVWLAHPLALLPLPAFVIYMNRFQIRPEEAALHAVFGAQFTAYAGSVRRWL